MKNVLRVTAGALAAALIPIAASAQQYPVKPVRIVVGFPAGGGTDIVARILGQKLADYLGQQVLVDNRGGASGRIGTDYVAKAAPDGYTLLMAHIAAVSILPSLEAKLPYDPEKDFEPISLVAIAPQLLVVNPSLPVRTVADLVAYAKTKPGQLQFASPGVGTVQHLAGELFKLTTKVDMVHVPYKGTGLSIVDLLAGQVHLDFAAIPPVMVHVKAGKLRPIAVTSNKRYSMLPDIPTVAEGGVKGFEMSTWWGLVAPAGVSPDVIRQLHATTIKALQYPEIKERIATVGAEPVGSTPEQFAAFIRSERAKYAEIITRAQIKSE
jgi:tripartite-type tricarboxylate transporter receptor subunit TctC